MKNEDPRKFKIEKFKIVGNFTIEIEFVGGEVQIIDFSEVKDPYWKELKDLNYFNQVELNDTFNLEWPPNLDFKPEHLYYWEKYKKYYQEGR